MSHLVHLDSFAEFADLSHAQPRQIAGQRRESLEEADNECIQPLVVSCS